jgi:hypothetical protein
MRRLLCFGTVVSALAALLLAAPAQAEDTVTSEQLALEVYLSSDPAATLASLDKGEVALLAARVSEWTAVVVETEPVKRVPTAQEKTALAAVAGAGCYSYRRIYDWYDLGVHTGQTWMTANWCGNNFGITSYSLTNRGGVGFNGVSYQGLGATSVNNVGWEVRQAQVFKFGFAWANANPCMQIRGGKTGLAGFQANCNLS